MKFISIKLLLLTIFTLSFGMNLAEAKKMCFNSLNHGVCCDGLGADGCFHLACTDGYSSTSCSGNNRVYLDESELSAEVLKMYEQSGIQENNCSAVTTEIRK